MQPRTCFQTRYSSRVGLRSVTARLVAFLVVLSTCCVTVLSAKDPIPNKLVVLTFDDSVKSHFTVVRPILKQYGFGATFFITEGFDFKSDKQNYMTWGEIATLHRDGFEIGNHTRDHFSIGSNSAEQLQQKLDELPEQVASINEQCLAHGIPKPVSYAYPGNGIAAGALPILEDLGIRFARRGGAPEYPYVAGEGFAYEPGLDHPLLIPSAGDARPDWTLDDFVRAVRQAERGRIAVLQFHGVPDLAHPWVNSPVEKFKSYMDYLAHNGYTVIALRDLEKYVDRDVQPKDAFLVIEDRQHAIAEGIVHDNARMPGDAEAMLRWLENMIWHHRYTVPEVQMATGLEADEVATLLEAMNISMDTRPASPSRESFRLLPYPGGRHPRFGFLDGAIRPQRETKLSVFLPWDDRQYVVLDVPEAIRRNDEATHGLLYLAHTHVDTMWTRQNIPLKPLEWQKTSAGSYEMERRLPNGVVFGTRATVCHDAVQMEMWLTNGSEERLSDLTVQNCVLLKGAPEFISDDEDRTILSKPFLARRSDQPNRWLITAWEPCQRVWANPSCPCLHSDPQFADCDPGETKTLRGWFSFYEGEDIEGELRRISDVGWLDPSAL